MGRFGNLDSKAQTALAVGGGLAAGAFLEHEIDEFSERPHHTEHHHLFGSMTSLIGAAGAGALGAKFFGRKGQAPQPAPPQNYQSVTPGWPGYPTSPPAYPVQSPPPPGQPMTSGSSPGLGGFGNLAVGSAAGVAGALAMGSASNLLHHHHSQEQIPATRIGSNGPGMSSFVGGLTHSGPTLHIHAATFADADVTQRVRALVGPSQELTIAKMSDEFGDPWPEAKRKSFIVLYQYGERPMEVWVGR